MKAYGNLNSCWHCHDRADGCVNPFLTLVEPLYLRSLSIIEQQLGENHPSVATSLNGLAFLYETQGKLEDAERLAQRALKIRQTTLGNDHPSTLVVLLTVKGFQMMMFLGCDKQTLFGILQAMAQVNNIPELNTETMLMLLEVIATNPELLQSLREAFTE